MYVKMRMLMRRGRRGKMTGSSRKRERRREGDGGRAMEERRIISEQKKVGDK